jgi:hypothetical protein
LFKRSYLKKTHHTKKGLVKWLEQEEHLPSKHEPLSSNSCAAKKKRRRRRKIGLGLWLKQ